MAHEERGRIVVGVDGSPSSTQALTWALRQAEITGASIEAVHAWQIPMTYGAPVAVLPGEDFAESAERALAESVDEVLGGREDLPVRRIAEHGLPAKVLLEHSQDAELLVVGSRGRGGFKGLLLGSVSLHCVTHAHCPVVVLRHED
ncbi:universal stress protein [Glycomyces arizonensis]|uniref:universal stress protein n=1 Tax=Glycomyces arizonensis TaxID=256035 RepID=UPI00047C3928|nr:universal stress protein [Glycomyces arizonensis]